MKKILFFLAIALFATGAAHAQSQRLSRTNKRVRTSSMDSLRKANQRTDDSTKLRKGVMTDADRNNPAKPGDPKKPAGTTTPSGTKPGGTTTSPAR